MLRSVRPAASNTKRSPGAGARPCGMKASAKPGCALSNGTWRAHLSATMQATPWPRSASSMAGSSRSANGSLPQRCDNATQPATAPGVVTVSQPRSGMLAPWRRSK